jgi:acetyl-CoA carboxylase carboxyl transferase subunit beta
MAEARIPSWGQGPAPEPENDGVSADRPAARERGGWFSKIAPGVRNLVARRETPENLWVKCPDTGEMIYRPDLEAAHWVTPSGRHMRIGPALRFAYTFDGGLHEKIAVPTTPDDPLHFNVGKSYRDSLAAARKTTGEREASSVAAGRIKGNPAVVLVQDFAFMGGTLGAAAGEAFITAALEAVRRQAPLVAFTASGGARMQEGALALMQMARTTLAIQDLKRARLPYIVVLTDPTTGGVTASYGMLGDVHLAEPGALIAFTGARVNPIKETLPPGYQRSEYLVERGMVDRVVTRHDLPEVLGSIIGILMQGRSRFPA